MAKRKFTWLDIAVIIVLVVSIAGVAYKFSRSSVSTPAAAKEKLLFTYYMETAPDNTINAIKIGDPVRDSVQNSDFGRVTEIITNESIFWESGEDGQLVASAREGYSSVLLKMETEGVINKNGVSVDKSLYFIGQTISLYAGSSQLKDGRISEIVRVGQ